MYNIRITGRPVIRPITFVKYTIIKSRYSKSNSDLLDLTNKLFLKGLDYDIRGDVLFILSIFMAYIGKNDINNNNLFGYGEFKTKYEAIDDVLERINIMRNNKILYQDRVKELTVEDLILSFISPGYDENKYQSYLEAFKYDDSYTNHFENIYRRIYEFEKALRTDEGKSVQTITKEDITRTWSIDIHDIQFRENLKNRKYSNKNLVIFKSRDKDTIAIASLLALKYKCPFIHEDSLLDKIRNDKNINIIIADTMSKEEK